MDLCKLIASQQWKQITLERTPESIAKELPMMEAIELADILNSANFYDDEMKEYSIKLLEATRMRHKDQWESSWRYDAFLGYCYYYIYEPEKAFEEYKSAMKKAPENPHPSLLIALASCLDLPGGISIGYSTAIQYLKMAIKNYLYINAIMRLRGIYRIEKDAVNEDFWSEMLVRALKTSMFSPSLQEVVYETDLDDAHTRWTYRATIDIETAKYIEEELRDILPKPFPN